MRTPASAEPKVHVWLPEVGAGVGGIQSYGADFIRALRDVWPGSTCEVFLKNDRGQPFSLNDQALRLHTAGGWPLYLRSVGYAATTLTRAIHRRPTLVISGHVHFGILAEWMERLTKVPYWSIVYGIEAWEVPSAASRRALRKSQLIISISRYTADRLGQVLGGALPPTEILPCTFDGHFFRPLPVPGDFLNRHGLRPDQRIILTVARLDGRERYKGYDVVLQALPRILRSIPDAHYVLVGGGNDQARFENLVRELGLEQCVTTTGYVPSRELRWYYNMSSLFAMPSGGEGFGIVYLEAMGCGKPVIAGNRGGAREALLDGELGVLVDPHDVDQFADAAISILERRHPNRITNDPEELRRRVLKEFGHLSFRNRLESILLRRGLLAR